MNIMLKRGLASLTNTATTRASCCSSYSCSLRRLFSSTSSPTPLHSSADNLVPSAAAEVADVDAPDNTPLPVVSHSHGSTVVKPVTPTLLQPRVVVYDGVCHLCHRGVKWVIRADKDRKIKFCCVQSNAAEAYLRACGLEREDVLRRFLFVEGLNVYTQGSTG